MAKFCGKCGEWLDEGTGLCLKCEAKQIKHMRKQSRKEQKKQKKNAKYSEMTVGRRIKHFVIKFLVTFFIALIFIIGVTCTLVYFDVVDIPGVDNFLDYFRDDDGSSEYQIIPPDADEYFGENSDVISVISVKNSVGTMTEADTHEQLIERGFDQYSITTEYSVDGEYHEATDISDNSSQKHPIYQTYYVTSNEELWTITVVNGVVMATPVSYNMQSKRDARLIISETDTVMSYDSTTNQFYETVPKESVLIVKKVSRIDKETLENLSIEAIDEL